MTCRPGLSQISKGVFADEGEGDDGVDDWCVDEDDETVCIVTDGRAAAAGGATGSGLGGRSADTTCFASLVSVVSRDASERVEEESSEELRTATCDVD